MLTSLPPLLAEQDYRRPWVPVVVGNLEFRVWKKQLERIDEILRLGQVEAAFVRLNLVRQKEREQPAAAKEARPVHRLTPGEQVLFQRRASQALRCMLVRTLTGEGLRPFARHLAESALRQWFCRLDRLEQVRIPSKSQLQRQAELVEETGPAHGGDQLAGGGQSSGGDRDSRKRSGYGQRWTWTRLFWTARA